MTEQYQQQQQVNLGHPESAEVTTTSLNHKAFLVGPAPLNSGPQHHQQQHHNHPASASYLASQQPSYSQSAAVSHSDNSAMTNGSISAVYGYDSPDCGYYEHQDCSSVDVVVNQQQQQPYTNNTRSTCAMQISVNSPVSVPIQQSSDSYSSSNSYHHLQQQQQHHLGQLQHQTTSGGSTVHHFASNNTAAVEELSPPQDNNLIGKLLLTVSDYCTQVSPCHLRSITDTRVCLAICTQPANVPHLISSCQLYHVNRRGDENEFFWDKEKIHYGSRHKPNFYVCH
jgi:hypothetical protein